MMGSRLLMIAAAVTGGVALAAPVSAQLLFSSLHARDGAVETRTRSYTPGSTIQANSPDGFARVGTDVGINRITARDGNGDGVEAGSLWGANFRLTGTSANPVRVSMTVRIDGTTGALPGPVDADDPPIGFNYRIAALKGRVASFDTDQSDGDIDAIIPGNNDIIQSRSLCGGGSCGFGIYDSLLTLDFDVGGNDEFFVYGLLQLVDLHYADFSFGNTARLTGITVGGDAVLQSDTGNLVRSIDGVYRFLPTADPGVVPEPGTWIMMVTGFALLGSSIRRRRSGRIGHAMPN